MAQPSRDRGSTLLEVLTTISLMGVLMALAVGGWSAWARASAHTGTAREIQSVLRQAQQRAVTEGVAACVLFDDAADTYTVYRGACSASGKEKVSGPVRTPAGVALSSPAFTSNGSPGPGVTFQARGTGSPGEVRVTRQGSSKVYELSVDWLTGRVSLS